MNELDSSEHWTVLKEVMLGKSESILGLNQRKHSKGLDNGRDVE